MEPTSTASMKKTCSTNCMLSRHWARNSLSMRDCHMRKYHTKRSMAGAQWSNPKTKTVGRTTEYTEEYCGKGTRMFKGHVILVGTLGVKANEQVQPVGGRLQMAARARADALGMCNRKPSYDSDYVASVFRKADMAHHRVLPQWQDPRWSPSVHAGNTTMYQPQDRDLAHRNHNLMYDTTRINPLGTPAHPLPVPDVHKLRYMHNNYMTSDDWY